MIQFDTQTQDDILIVSIVGSLDAITSEEATEYLNNLIQDDAAQVVLNLETLEYISSAGVRVLLGAIKATRSAGGDLRLAQITNQVLETLEMAGITSIVKYYDEVNSAVVSFED